jgi:hypothetical protein
LKNNIHNYKQIIEQVTEGVSKWEVFAKESHVMTDVAKFINKNLLVTL